MASQLHDEHRWVSRFFTSMNASSYDAVVRLATFGQDYIWKKQILDLIDKHLLSCSCLPSSSSSSSLSSDVLQSHMCLDLASGTGILSSLLERHGNQRGGRPRNVVSLDFTFDYLQIAKKKFNTGKLINGTAQLLPYREQ